MQTNPQFQHLKVTGPVSILPASLDECYPEDEVCVYVIFGPTGAGKSTFIEQFSPNDTLHISKNSLESVTQTIVLYQVINVTIDDRTILLLDTPGFSDAKISEDHVLAKVNHFLDMSMLSATPTQMLFFERITDTRKAGSGRRAVNMFKIFTKSFDQKDITIVTTMWNQLVNPEKGSRRLQELERDFWLDIIQKGAKIVKFECSLQSALNVLDSGAERIISCGPLSRGNFALTRASDKTYEQLIDQSIGSRIEGLQQQLQTIEENLQDQCIQQDEQLMKQLGREREEAKVLLQKFQRQLLLYMEAAEQAQLGNPMAVRSDEDADEDEEQMPMVAPQASIYDGESDVAQHPDILSPSPDTDVPVKTDSPPRDVSAVPVLATITPPTGHGTASPSHTIKGIAISTYNSAKQWLASRLKTGRGRAKRTSRVS